MKRLRILVVITLVNAAAVAATAKQSADQTAAKVDEYMNAAVRTNGFSGTILVARDGQPVFSKGYGMANYELAVPNTPQTVFRLGSLTKPFTATVIMMLHERGRLNTSDSICKHLSECPPAWQPVTIRHLLTHTSGIPDYTHLTVVEAPRSQPFTHAELIGLFKNKPLEFAPGEKFSASNSGYYLLGVIIERASGKSYEDFLRDSMFNPLGMTSTGYDRPSRVIKNRASGYGSMAGSLVNAAYIDMSSPFAAGGLYSTVDDLLRFDEALSREKLVSRRSLEEMSAPSKNDYGYGWYMRNRFARQVWDVDGSIGGFFASFSRFPTDRVTVIVLSNTAPSNTRGMANDLSAIAFAAPYTVPQPRQAIALAADVLEKYAGAYQADNGVVVTITVENGKLMRQLGEQPREELYAASETEFFLKGIDLPIRFTLNAQGRVTGYVTRPGGREVFRPKIK
jgi:CubicO group peptidase (beta-lactamase class C family)